MPSGMAVPPLKGAASVTLRLLLRKVKRVMNHPRHPKGTCQMKNKINKKNPLAPLAPTKHVPQKRPRRAQRIPRRIPDPLKLGTEPPVAVVTAGRGQPRLAIAGVTPMPPKEFAGSQLALLTVTVMLIARMGRGRHFSHHRKP